MKEQAISLSSIDDDEAYYFAYVEVLFLQQDSGNVSLQSFGFSCVLFLTCRTPMNDLTESAYRFVMFKPMGFDTTNIPNPQIERQDKTKFRKIFVGLHVAKNVQLYNC